MLSGSITISRTLRRGLSDEIGSWKIICMRVRASRIASPCMRGELLALEAAPSRDVGRGSCMMARPVVLLPQPDSPTRPSVSPVSTSRLMPLTALHLEAGAADGELDDEVLDAQQRRRASRAGGRCRYRPSVASCGASVRGRVRRGLRRGDPHLGFVVASGLPTGIPAGVAGDRGPRRSRPAAAPRRRTCLRRTGSGARSGSPSAG